MMRKLASFAFGLALVVALGFALAHASALKVPGASTGFSAPCEPASPALKSADEANVASSVVWTLAVDSSAAAGVVVRSSRAEADARPSRRSAPRVFPPLLHRPPPAVS